MKVIFLDFDGVLNSTRFMMENPQRGLCGLDKVAVARLNRLCAETGAYVVVFMMRVKVLLLLLATLAREVAWPKIAAAHRAVEESARTANSFEVLGIYACGHSLTTLRRG